MIIPKSHTLETLNFILRIPSEDDFPHIFSATRQEGFNDGMLWEPPESQEELIAPLQNALKAWETGEGYSFTIQRKDSGEFLGRISIRKTSTANTWNTGFWIHPQHQRQGIMTEALAAIIDFAFTQLSAQNIEACHALWNKASEQVLQKNGFTFSRYIEKGFLKKGIWVAENLLLLKRADWKRDDR